MKKTSRLKGMTLMEIVVSLAIYSLIALLLVQIMTTVNTVMRQTTMLNTRLAYEAKHADNRLTDSDGKGTVEVRDNLNVQIEYAGGPDAGLGINGNQYIYKFNDSGQVKEDDPTEYVHYKYMVFRAETIETTEYNPDDPFLITFKDFPFDKLADGKDIEISRLDMGGASDDPGTLLNSPGTPFFAGKAKRDAEGNEILDADGHKVYEEGKEPIDAWFNFDSTNRTVTVRLPKSQDTTVGNEGKDRVRIVMYADVTSFLHVDPDQMIYERPKEGAEEGATPVGYRADCYPFLKFTITYTSWTKDAAGNVYSFDNPGCDFQIVSDSEDGTHYTVRKIAT